MRLTRLRKKLKTISLASLCLAAVAAALFAVVGVRLLQPSSAAVPRLPWSSGIVIGTPSQVTAWESFRGLSVDVVHAFAARSNWQEVESAGWIMGYYKTSAEKLVISQPFWPEGIGGSMSACANGAYDANWRRYGESLTRNGRVASTTTRLAWEFNGNWFQWSAHNPTEWKACWRKVVTAVRSTAPTAKFEWAMNAHGSQTSGGSAWNSYPGDDVVDVIGIDPYDHYPASRTAAEFDKQCNDSEGLCNVIKVARQRGKTVGVGEWGVAKGGGGAGDNPLYIQKMYETFRDGADVMGYETYFNEDAYGNALVNPRQNPQSADKYIALFGGKSPSIITAPPPTPPPSPKAGDVSGPTPGVPDGTVNLRDLSFVLINYGKPSATPADGDISGSTPGTPDGTINLKDISFLLINWG